MNSSSSPSMLTPTCYSVYSPRVHHRNESKSAGTATTETAIHYFNFPNQQENTTSSTTANTANNTIDTATKSSESTNNMMNTMTLEEFLNTFDFESLRKSNPCLYKLLQKQQKKIKEQKRMIEYLKSKLREKDRNSSTGSQENIVLSSANRIPCFSSESLAMNPSSPLVETSSTGSFDLNETLPSRGNINLPPNKRMKRAMVE